MNNTTPKKLATKLQVFFINFAMQNKNNKL